MRLTFIGDTRTLQLFTSHINILLRCGFSITSILDTLAKSKGKLGTASQKMHDDIFSGLSISEAMSCQKDIFPLSYVQIVRTGELSGQLAESFNRLARNLEREAQLKARMLEILIYPAALILITAILMFVGVYGIFPMILKVTAISEKDLPWITRALITLSSPKALNLIIFVVSAPAIFIYWLFHHPQHSLRIRAFSESYTPIGKLAITARLVLCIRQLSLMIDSGVDLLRSLRLLEDLSQGLLTLQNGFKSVRNQVSQGESIHTAMAKEEVFPPFLVSMFAAGEDSASISKLLDQSANIMEDELYRKIKMFASLVEPVTIGILGIGVGGIILAILLPIYSLANIG